MPTAAELIVSQLVACGASNVFGVPGESYLSVLDALRDRPELRFVTCRQEGGAAFAAEASGKLTGAPGVLMVTRGPGLMNAAIGVHAAQQDETPLLVLVGLIPDRQVGRDAFQEFDLVSMFGPMCNWVHRLTDPDRAAEVVATAWARTQSGRPGPVVVGLPEDVLDRPTDASTVAIGPAPRTGVASDVTAAVLDAVGSAERPVVIAGGSRWTQAAVELLPRAFGDLPIVTGFRRQDLVDHRLACYAGTLGLGADPALVDALGQSDLVVAIGDRLDDPTTNGFTLLGGRASPQRLIHVRPDSAELGRVWTPDLAVVADPETFLGALGRAGADRPAAAPTAPTAPSAWAAERRADAERWSATPGLLDDIARGLPGVLPADAVLTNGAGNFTRPFQRSYPYGRPGRQLAPVLGSMGYGVPAAIAAKVQHPDRTALCITGDGDFLMNGQELATAIHENAPIVVLLVDNSCYGTIRTHQERRFPGRPIGVRLTNPDFAALARSYGFDACTVDTAPDTLQAIDRGVRLGRPTLVHLVTER